jgi:hypothetical protein
MTRRLLFLIASVLGLVLLVVGPSLVPARAAVPPTPVVRAATTSRPLTCFGIWTRGACLTLS